MSLSDRNCEITLGPGVILPSIFQFVRDTIFGWSLWFPGEVLRNVWKHFDSGPIAGSLNGIKGITFSRVKISRFQAVCFSVLGLHFL